MARLTITPGGSGRQWFLLRGNKNRSEAPEDKGQGARKMVFKIGWVMHEYMHNRGGPAAPWQGPDE